MGGRGRYQWARKSYTFPGSNFRIKYPKIMVFEKFFFSKLKKHTKTLWISWRPKCALVATLLGISIWEPVCSMIYWKKVYFLCFVLRATFVFSESCVSRVQNDEELLENTMLRCIFSFTHQIHTGLFQIDSLVSGIQKLVPYSARCHGARIRLNNCFQRWNTSTIFTVRQNSYKSSKYWKVWVTVPMVILIFQR